MLTELSNTRQILGESDRRWFMSPAMDLIVWHDVTGKATGFQLCYDKESNEKAITWFSGSEPVHTAISTGEGLGMKHKESPILVADGSPNYAYIQEQFLKQSEKLPSDVVELVVRTLSARI